MAISTATDPYDDQWNEWEEFCEENARHETRFQDTATAVLADTELKRHHHQHHEEIAFHMYDDVWQLFPDVTVSFCVI